MPEDSAPPVLETLGRPEYPASVQWSPDNLLAVAAGAGVVVINPSHVCGPRGSTANPEPNCSFMEVDAYLTPRPTCGREACIQHARACWRAVELGSEASAGRRWDVMRLAMRCSPLSQTTFRCNLIC